MSRSKILPIYLGSFFLISGLSYFLFSSLIPAKGLFNSDSSQSSKSTPTPPKTGVIAFSGPKTEACPLNGQLYTKEEQAIWSQRRPLSIMIENHADARPQSGLQNADIVYEAVAEGGITRFMGVFYCGAVAKSSNKYDVGPVRSARTYFLDLASEYADYPLYAHVGGANCSAPKDPVTGRQAGPCTTNKKAQAIEQIQDYGWNNKGTWGDLSQFSLSYKVCRREPERTGDTKATEHTMYCNSSELWNAAEDRGLTNITLINKTSWDKSYRPWLTKAADQSAAAPAAKTIAFDFWGDSAYAVAWNYDSNRNVYLRSNGGQAHLDFNTGEVITAKNLVVQYVKESKNIDEHFHNLYQIIGSGDGILFQNGEKIEISWSKASRTARTIFKDKATNKEINFVPGNIWIELLPLGKAVKYDNS